ncbi:MAG: hypothetical protein KF752_02790 [Pirellulaceae bacterium]|nr:hypothetical protein [Pirellulaceae bacterium]
MLNQSGRHILRIIMDQASRMPGWQRLAVGWLAGWLVLAPVVSWSQQQAVEASTSDKAPFEFRKIECEHLVNCIQVHAQVFSGGLPQGEAAFAELAKLGVKTVISVDGATPDVEAATKHRLSYVHLPHGYDGISDSRVMELAKAVRTLQGPVYIHCHHGRHRSPAAAAAACVSAGLVTPSAALDILKLAGTDPNYRGLYQAVRRAVPVDLNELDALPVQFQPVSPIPPMAEAMVDIEELFGRLKRFSQGGWQRLDNHPDLDPVHEALLLYEHYVELLRTPQVSELSDDFQQSIRESVQATGQLKEVLELELPKPTPDTLKTLDRLVLQIGQQCKSCHQQFRDVPLGEK